MSTTSHLEPAGVGAYHPNPWRRLSEAEIEGFYAKFGADIKAQFAVRRPQIVNGAQVWYFNYPGYPSIMYQTGPGGAYWFVYNHPGQVVFNMKQYERPVVPSRTALRGVPHWPGVGHADEGLGAYVALPNPNNRPEISAAIDLLAYFDANGCSKTSLPVVVAFQNAYNASGLPGQLTLDGEYGPNTQRALQNVMDEAQADAGAGPSQQAPTNCFPEYGQVPSIPALDRPVATPAPATPSGTYVAPVTTVSGDTGKSNAAVLLIGGAVAAVAGGYGVYYWRKHRRGR